MIAVSFVVQVMQQLVLALGLALAGANAFAIVVNRRARKRYDAELTVYETTRRLKDKSKRTPKPNEPKHVRIGPAVVNIVIGLAIAVIAVASLTFGFISS